MKINKICVLGGTGFVGSHLIARLANNGYRVRALSRHPYRHRELLVMPEVELQGVDDFNPETLAARFAGCQAVINLVGILNGSAAAFQAAHVELPASIVSACQQTGTRRYLHMSALNADAEQGPSRYLKSKGAGEAAAHAGAEQGLLVTSFRPSIIFGPGDGFFNRFAAMLRLSPVLPLACPGARFAPVYVEDVVQAFVQTLTDESSAGQRYELCGPKVYTLKELIRYTARLLGQRRLIIDLPDGLARLQAKVFERLPGQIFTTDNYLSLQVDSVCSSDGLAALGIFAKSVESLLPRQFGEGTRSTQYSSYRRLSRR